MYLSVNVLHVYNLLYLYQMDVLFLGLEHSRFMMETVVHTGTVRADMLTLYVVDPECHMTQVEVNVKKIVHVMTHAHQNIRQVSSPYHLYCLDTLCSRCSVFKTCMM